MSRSRKVCLLRKPAEIESLSNLRKLQHQVRTGKLSEDQAAEQFKTAQLPDCAHHHHLTIREAHQQENAGRLQFLSGWGEQYAQSTHEHPGELPRSWMVRKSGWFDVLQLVEA